MVVDRFCSHESPFQKDNTLRTLVLCLDIVPMFLFITCFHLDIKIQIPTMPRVVIPGPTHETNHSWFSTFLNFWILGVCFPYFLKLSCSFKWMFVIFYLASISRWFKAEKFQIISSSILLEIMEKHRSVRFL